MKLNNQKRFAFIGKSMLWSLLLYVAMMVAFNWDDVRNSVTGKNNITVIRPVNTDSQSTGINEPGQAPTSISGHTGLVKSLIAVLKVISGISGQSDSH